MKILVILVCVSAFLVHEISETNGEPAKPSNTSDRIYEDDSAGSGEPMNSRDIEDAAGKGKYNKGSGNTGSKGKRRRTENSRDYEDDSAGSGEPMNSRDIEDAAGKGKYNKGSDNTGSKGKRRRTENSRDYEEDGLGTNKDKNSRDNAKVDDSCEDVDDNKTKVPVKEENKNKILENFELVIDAQQLKTATGRALFRPILHRFKVETVPHCIYEAMKKRDENALATLIKVAHTLPADLKDLLELARGLKQLFLACDTVTGTPYNKRFVLMDTQPESQAEKPE